LNRAWFRRAWIYQEVIVAAEVEVYCGNLCIPFDSLARLVLSTYYLSKVEKDGIWSGKIKRSEGFGPRRPSGMTASNITTASGWIFSIFYGVQGNTWKLPDLKTWSIYSSLLTT
jgi:hypothetical protein